MAGAGALCCTDPKVPLTVAVLHIESMLSIQQSISARLVFDSVVSKWRLSDVDRDQIEKHGAKLIAPTVLAGSGLSIRHLAPQYIRRTQEHRWRSRSVSKKDERSAGSSHDKESKPFCVVQPTFFSSIQTTVFFLRGSADGPSVSAASHSSRLAAWSGSAV